jgi:hypothetical protein
MSAVPENTSRSGDTIVTRRADTLYSPCLTSRSPFSMASSIPPTM